MLESETVDQHVLAAAAISLPSVEANDALLQVTDTIALETLAVAMPAAIVDCLNDHLREANAAATQQHKRNVSFNLAPEQGYATGQRTKSFGSMKNASLDESRLVDGVLDLNASQMDFVDAIEGRVEDLKSSKETFLEAEMVSRSLSRENVSAEVMAENVPAGDSKAMSEVQSVVDAISTVQEIATAVLAEVISGTAATEMIAGASAEAQLPVVETIPQKYAEEKKEEKQVPGKETALDQPLAYIIARHPVWVATGFPTSIEIEESINHLDNLICALQRVDAELHDAGLSPGFETRTSAKKWFAKNIGSAYETLPSVHTSKSQGPAIPMPSPAAAVKYYLGIRETWLERKRYVESMGKGNFCSCVKSWDHTEGDVLAKLSNQSLEQDMIREASDCVTGRMQQPGCMRGEAWDRLYAPELCPTPSSVDHLYIKNASIRVLSGRDDYISTLVSLALRAEHTIDVATCYIFPHDPAQRYILLDLLPFIARTRGVTIRLLCDMMPVESSIVKSAIRHKKKKDNAGPVKRGEPTHKKKSRAGVYPLSFLDSLPADAPALSERTLALPESPMDFLRDVLAEAFSSPDDRFQIRWWCARDSQDKYRIKNHAKCLVFDGATDGPGMALMGGSNIVPTIESGDSDLDTLVGGRKVVQKIGETFNFLWDSMCAASSMVNCTEIIDVEDPNDNDEEAHAREESTRSAKFPEQAWTDPTCRAALIRSEPCSAGSDVIFRHVLGAISAAEKTIDMCMGHSNKPMALAQALGNAVQRGVRVRLLVNSIYSCDLRVNQRDLFRSLKDLLTVAPGVEVWTTALRSHRATGKNTVSSADEEKKEEESIAPYAYEHQEEDSAPPFLHSKYTVIDGKWVAVGSWNVWTRSAFYEIEHELLIYSESIGRELEKKFERERDATSVLLTTPEECDFWCPTGCKLCQPFGPFYV